MEQLISEIARLDPHYTSSAMRYAHSYIQAWKEQNNTVTPEIIEKALKYGMEYAKDLMSPVVLIWEN